jgi:hypothetical protein
MRPFIAQLRGQRKRTSVFDCCNCPAARTELETPVAKNAIDVLVIVRYRATYCLLLPAGVRLCVLDYRVRVREACALSLLGPSVRDKRCRRSTPWESVPASTQSVARRGKSPVQSARARRALITAGSSVTFFLPELKKDILYLDQSLFSLLSGQLRSVHRR